MALGDAATAAGMDIVDGTTTDAKTIGDEITKSRDYIAERTTDVQPITKGGTGAQTASQARINLGVQGAVDEIAAASPSGAIPSVSAGKLVRWTPEGRISVSEPSSPTHAATKGYVDARPTGVPSSGGTFTGDVRFPNATPATSGYAVAYINGDGRLAKNASSERYKKFISSIDPASLGDVWPDLVRYQMRGGDGTWKYGYIAERLDESDDLRPFVVYDGDGQPDSIDFIMMLMVQNAQLHQAVELLAQRIDAIEAS